MDNDKISIGDIVELNSGGFPMTVIRIKDGNVYLEWDEDENKLCGRWLPIVCVKLFQLCK